MKKKFVCIGIGVLAISMLGGVAALALSGTQEAAPLIGGMTPMPPDNSGDASLSGNVHMEQGTQIIDITAKGGYQPAVTTAKANVPTIIRVKTDSTFDCTTSLTIPSLHYRTRLPFAGSTDIDVPSQLSGSELVGVCSMGMNSFQVKFSG